jgi:hypothetical protein
MTSPGPKPFELHISDHDLDRLRQRLSLTRFPNELDEARWHYGAPLMEVKRLAEYWRDGFDWKAQQSAINRALPQFTTDISVDDFGTLNIHFVHKRSKVEEAVPLLFVHGCESIDAYILAPVRKAGTHSRARIFPRGYQSPPSMDRSKWRQPKLPRGSPQPARLRLFTGADEAGLQDWAVCRGKAIFFYLTDDTMPILTIPGLQQVDAVSRLYGVCRSGW